MNIPFWLINSCGIGFLIYFSYLDLKYQEIENKPILVVFLLGLVFSCFNNQIVENLIATILFLGIGFLLWSLKIFGGADAKILAIIPLFFGFLGIPNMLSKIWIFLIIFLIIGLIYGLVMRICFKNKKIVPFIPSILISFLIFLMFKIT